MSTSSKPRSSEAAPSKPAPTTPAGEVWRVIVLDPDVRDLARAATILSQRGYLIITTNDPAVALRATQEAKPGLLLADLAMEAIDLVPFSARRKSDPPPAPISALGRQGYAILCPLGAKPNLAGCPVVFLKASGTTTEGPRGPRFAVVGFMAKPFTDEALAQLVERALPRREVRASAGPDRRAPSGRAAAVAGPGFEVLPKPLLKALIVDGSEDYRQFVRGLLLPHGFEVYEAADGEEGLKMALSKRPWLILTDVNIGLIDGFEFCRRVKRHTLLKHTPLVFLSSWDEYWERYHGLKLGADDYLSKQTPARELLIRIQLILKRYSDVGTRTTRGAGMEGGIELIGVPGMLQMCHLGRFSGVCTLRSGAERIRIAFREGEIVSAESSRAQGAEAVYELVTWTSGRFEFLPGDPGEGEPLGQSFDHLLLEGCRRLDEQRRGCSGGGTLIDLAEVSGLD